MEIFRVASQQFQDSNMQVQNGNVSNRSVEQTNIQENVVQDDSSQKTSKEELENAIQQLNEHMAKLETNVRFGFNDKVNYMFVSVLRADNGEVIRKIPSEQVMKLTENFKEIAGALFDKKE